MQSVCAWCGVGLGGESEGPGRPVSHGICKPCFARFWEDPDVSLRDFVVTLDAPVFLTDGDLRVQTAAESGVAIAGKALAEIEGRLGGQVFQCTNASLPGGCGHSVNCSGCTLRKTVTDTYRTGTPHVRVPTTLNVRKDGSAEDVSLFVTTEKVADRVLLQIETR